MSWRLTVFLLFFPLFQWLLELLMKWTMDEGEPASFLGPTMASAALALIAPIALPKRASAASSRADGEPHPVTFWALIAMLFGIVCWTMCMVIGMKKRVPQLFAQYAGFELWQFGLGITLYCVAIWLVVWNERTA